MSIVCRYTYFIQRKYQKPLVYCFVLHKIEVYCGCVSLLNFWQGVQTQYSQNQWNSLTRQHTVFDSDLSKLNKMHCTHILTNKHRIVFEVELIDKCHLNQEQKLQGLTVQIIITRYERESLVLVTLLLFFMFSSRVFTQIQKIISTQPLIESFVCRRCGSDPRSQ